MIGDSNFSRLWWKDPNIHLWNTISDLYFEKNNLTILDLKTYVQNSKMWHEFQVTAKIMQLEWVKFCWKLTKWWTKHYQTKWWLFYQVCQPPWWLVAQRKTTSGCVQDYNSTIINLHLRFGFRTVFWSWAQAVLPGRWALFGSPSRRLLLTERATITRIHN